MTWDICWSRPVVSPSHPTNPFSNLEPGFLSSDVSKLLKIRQSSDFEALKLWKRLLWWWVRTASYSARPFNTCKRRAGDEQGLKVKTFLHNAVVIAKRQTASSWQHATRVSFFTVSTRLHIKNKAMFFFLFFVPPILVSKQLLVITVNEWPFLLDIFIFSVLRFTAQKVLFFTRKKNISFLMK